MEYKLSEILDLENLKSLMDNFYKITKVPYGLLDSNGDIVLGIGWQEICINFHRKNEVSSTICRKSNVEGFEKSKSHKYYTHKCKHGLIDSFIPVIVKGATIAYLALGQFFFKEPDLEYFINQAKQYNYDIDGYLQAVKKVPIVSEENFNNYIDYYIDVVNMIKSHGEKFIDQKNTEKLLIENKAQLQKEVIEKNKQLKKALKYDLLKTEFFSNLSHEIRTPINVIYSALQTASSFVDGIETDSRFEKDKVEKYVGIMKQNCFRLIRLINNILDITKLDSGYLKLELQNSNIVEIIENITLSVVDYIESTGIEVVFDTEIEEKNILCDPEKIERVILNLLSNAVKFTEKGGKIYVNIIDIGENIMISVRDTGKGIPVERQKHIFERFVQGDKSLSGLQEGSGIGLSLVKSIVEIHGGEITMNSQIGVGTEFIINLPVKLVDDNEPLKSESYQNNTNVEKVSIEFSDIYF